MRRIIGIAFAGVVLIVIIGAIAGSGNDDEPSRATPTAQPTPTRSASVGTPARTTPSRSTPTRPAQESVREQVENCLDPWDGNHNGFEAQIRAVLKDPDSMSTQSTRFSLTPTDGSVSITLDYTARNSFGGTVRNLARGRLNLSTCRVTVLDFGE